MVQVRANNVWRRAGERAVRKVEQAEGAGDQTGQQSLACQLLTFDPQSERAGERGGEQAEQRTSERVSEAAKRAKRAKQAVVEYPRAEQGGLRHGCCERLGLRGRRRRGESRLAGERRRGLEREGQRSGGR